MVVDLLEGKGSFLVDVACRINVKTAPADMQH